MTTNRATVLAHLLGRSGEGFWSYDVSKNTGVETGLVGRILAGLEAEGYATSWWAGRDGSDGSADGPRRHWFRLTERAQDLGADVSAFLHPDGDPSMCPGCDADGRCSCCGLTHHHQ
jgi:hypothetical protein